MNRSPKAVYALLSRALHELRDAFDDNHLTINSFQAGSPVEIDL